jgi:hypothetical protein
MEVSYDALRRLIQKELEAIAPASGSEKIKNKKSPETTRAYCKDLVRGELYNKFLNDIDQIERATKGKLSVKEGEGEGQAYVCTSNFNKQNVKLDTCVTRIKILKSKKTPDVIEDEIEKPSAGEVNDRREALFGPYWRTFRQLSKGIVATNEGYQALSQRWNRYLEEEKIR